MKEGDSKMKDRITKCFERARVEKRGAFVGYLTMGYPTLEACERGADELVAGGVDILELGVPFSDPFADGAVIRAAAYKALEQGVDMEAVLAAASRIFASTSPSAAGRFPSRNAHASSNRRRYSSRQMRPRQGAEHVRITSARQCRWHSASGSMASHSRIPHRFSTKSFAARTTGADGNGPK